MGGATGEQDWYVSGVFNMSFINLNDTFGDYVDRAGKVPKVNPNEYALMASAASIDAHKGRHESGGADEITGITDKLNNHSDRHEDGGADVVLHNNLALNPDDHHAKTGDNEVYGLVLTDTQANRPAAGIAERYFYATDEGILYRDDGASWYKAAVKDYADLDGTVTNHAGRHEDGGADEVSHNNLALNPDDHHAKTGDNEVYGLILSDTAANRPAAGVAERYFFATDEGILYYDDGAAWNKAAVSDFADLDGKNHAARHEDGGADEILHNNLGLTEGDHHEPVFTRLNDTPADYVGNAGKVHKVNPNEYALMASAASIDAHKGRHESGGLDEVLHNNMALNPDDHHAPVIPSGTKMVFKQSAAPSLWTFVVEDNDRALINTDTEADGGTIGGAWQQDGHTLAISEIPGHDHGGGGSTGNAGGHAHNIRCKATTAGEVDPTTCYPGNSDSGIYCAYEDDYMPSDIITSVGDHNHSYNVASEGGGGAHDHGSAWRPAYVKVITCSKD